MSGIIQNFVRDDDNVTLHVGLTGGMRHVNMMMLGLTRLLEYCGLTVGKFLYSNYQSGRVEETQNVYALLIAGVEEFVNFGSVNALERYYRNKHDNLSEPLNQLLVAMKDFAATIKFCHYGQFSAAIINFHDAVKDFTPTDNIEDVLMVTFITRIRKKYANLIFPRKKDDLRVIGWCLVNDYLQQALILYTERIPAYLGEKNIIAFSAEQAKELKNRTNKHKLQPFFICSATSLLKETNSTQGNKLDKGKKIFCKMIKNNAWSAIRANAFNFDDWLETLNQKLMPLNLHCPDDATFRAQLETLSAVFRDPKLLFNLSSPELEAIRKILDALDEELKAKKWGNERIKILM